LLGEHLYEKSDAVQWISVESPQKRKVRKKGYQELQRMAESDPDSNDLYQANLIDNFYPNRPDSLSHVYLYDFVKWHCRDDDYVRAGKSKFLITEYMTSTNQMNERHTFTLYCCYLYHSLMN